MRRGEVTVKAVLVLAAIAAPPLLTAGWRAVRPLVAEAQVGAGWLDVVQTFGITAICLGALAVAVWRALIWVGEKVVVPVAQRHIKFLDEVTASLKAQRESQDAHMHLLEAMEQRLAQRIDQLQVRTTSVVIDSERRSGDATDPGRGR